LRLPRQGAGRAKDRGSAEAGTLDNLAVGEEADVSLPKARLEKRGDHAPLGRVDAMVRRGDDVLVEVVVRTRKVGHFFPGGTIDAFDVWVELQATDDKGRRFLERQG